MYGDDLHSSLGCGPLWHNTVGYGATAPRVSYLTEQQNIRLERMRIAKMLWRGWHRRVYLHEDRTQWPFPEIEVQGRTIRPYVTFNILKQVSTTLTDLLLGEEPLLRADDEIGQAAIDDLKNRSDVARVFYDAVRCASWSGEGLVEVTRWDGQVWVQDVRSRDVFPIGDRQPDGQYASYVRFATVRISRERELLLQTTYSAGLIQRACFVLFGGQKVDQVPLDQWPVKQANGSPLADNESTGIAWNTLIWVGNEIDEGEATSDYDGLIELQDELNAKQTQIARVLALHSDPKLAAPETAADPSGNLRASQSVFFYRSKDDVPSYITWNAELASAIEDRNTTLNALCLASELSPGLLGLEQGAAPDSARKLRLQATKSLARVRRKAAFVRPFIKTALDTALQMMIAGKRVQVAMGAATVDLRDGLPVDDLDQAQTISTLTAGKQAMSIERAVSLQIADPAAAAQEVDRIKAEIAAATPSVLLGTNAGAEAHDHLEAPGASATDEGSGAAGAIDASSVDGGGP
jgi:hypothetical protein